MAWAMRVESFEVNMNPFFAAFIAVILMAAVIASFGLLPGWWNKKRGAFRATLLHATEQFGSVADPRPR
jgi:hypothetical protein